MENLQDLLTIDTDKQNAGDNKKLLRKLKQLIKSEKKQEVNLDSKAENLPYEAVSVIGTKHITVKFDLDSREAVVSEIEEDERKQHYMALFHAKNKLVSIGKTQTEDK